MQINELQARRERIFAQMPMNSMLVVFSGTPIYASQDQHFPFEVNRHFYYISGLQEKKMAVLMVKGVQKESVHLFIERYDEEKAKWVGKMMQTEEAKERSGMTAIHYMDELEAILAGQCRILPQAVIYFDTLQYEFDQQRTDTAFARRFQQAYPHIAVCDAHALLTASRLCKSAAEVMEIQKAIDITQTGIEQMMRNVKAGMMEYQLEAHFQFALMQKGCRQSAFATILAGGENATVLHYGENNMPLQDGSLVLCDLGARHGLYCADISRTFPVNGVFTARQRQIYDIVLAANEDVIAHAKVGTTLRALNQRVIDFYAHKLKEIGLIVSMEEVSKYYYHGVSHMLGLDTHDVSLPDYVLQPGNVITVEPGLYIAEECIGIRIEDDILITEDGPINLSKNIIKTCDAIESYMK